MATWASRFHAVVLVLDQSSDLHPLVSADLPAALLPVANSPALSYSLRLLDSCQVSGITLVVSGKSHALQVSSWLAQEHSPDLGLPAGAGSGGAAAPGGSGQTRRLIREILVVPESFGSADAVRAVLSQGRSGSISSEAAGRSGGGSSCTQNENGIIITAWSSSGSSSVTSSSNAGNVSSSTASGSTGAGSQQTTPASATASDSAAGVKGSDASRLGSDSLLVLDASVICDLSLGAMAAAHCRTGATVTAVLVADGEAASDAGSAAARGGHVGDGASKEKAKGKGPAPESKDLIGLDAAGKQQLVYFAGNWKGPGKGKEGNAGSVSLPQTVLETAGGVLLHSSLQDARLYAFHSSRLQKVLEDRPRFSCLRKDVVPFLVQQQWQEQQEISKQQLLGMLQGKGQDTGGHLGVPRSFSSSKGEQIGPGSHSPKTYCCAYVAPRGVFWRRVSSLNSFADANHALLTEEAVHLTQLHLSSFNNIIHPTVTLGSKSAVGAHCMVGEGTQLGEKCSVKRSLVGRHCRIGNNVKITDSVIMDYVTLENGCSLQGSVVSCHASVKEFRNIKDCRVGAHVVVNSDEKEASLAKS